MIPLNIALLLIAGAFVLGWLFEGAWSKAVRLVDDATNWRDLRDQEELDRINAADLAAQRARDDAQLRQTEDW